MKLRIQLSKTSLGDSTYLQIISDDTVTVNIVLVAEDIELHDDRPKHPTQRRAQKIKRKAARARRA